MNLKYYIPVMLAAVFLCSRVTAKNSNETKADSLISLYKKANNDTTRIKLLLETGSLFKDDKPDSALYYYKRAKDIIENGLSGIKEKGSPMLKKYLSLKLSWLFYISYYCYTQSDFEKAIEYNFKSLEIYKELGDKKGMAKSYNNIGLCNSYLGKYDKAIAFNFKSLKINEEIGFREGISACLSNIGIVYYAQNSFDKALDYFERSYKIDGERKDKAAMSIDLGNIGNIYYLQKDFDNAIEYYTESLKMCIEIGDRPGVSRCYINIGKIYQDRGDLTNAIDYFQKGLKVSIELGNKDGIAAGYTNLGTLEIKYSDSLARNRQEKSRHLNLALDYLVKSLKLAGEIRSPERENEASSRLMYAYKKMGDYVNAIKYADIYISTRDSMFNREKTKSLADAEARFNAEKKQLQIDKLNKEKELQHSELLRQQETGRRQRLVIIFIIIGLIFVTLFAMFIVQRLRITRKQKKIIETQKDEIEEQRDIVTIQRDHIEEQKQEITDSITYARLIQHAVLPSGEYADRILGDYFILFRPKDIVSGDFYWATQVNDWLIVTVADCTGHGVPGAFMSMLGVSFLNEIVRKKEVMKASEILDRLRDSIIEALNQKGLEGEQKDGMDITFCAMNKNTGLLQYSGANNPLFIVTKSEELKIIQPDKQPVAIYDNMRPFTNNEIQMEKGDCIYLASDGYEDQFGGPNNRKFMSKHLKEMFVQIAGKPMNEQKEILEKTFNDWKGDHEQIDDVTIMGIRI